MINNCQKEYDLLARGSAFYVSTPISGAVLALVSAHVAAPHRFPNFYPHEWLRHVRDKDCRTVFETRSTDGKQVVSHVMVQPLVGGFRHASLDVAAFLLDETVLTENANIPVLQLPPPDMPVSVRDSVTIAGFRLSGESGSGTEAVIATELPGTVSEVWPSRVFVDTGDVETEMGMCGGPMVMKEDRSTCVGILEGLVPRVTHDLHHGDKHKRLQGKSVLVHANELRKFLHDVETEVAKVSASPINKS